MPSSQFPSADLPVSLSHLLPWSVLGIATRSQFIAILWQCFAISLRRPQILTCAFQLLELWNKFSTNLMTTNYVLHAQILWVRTLDREQWRWLVSGPWSLDCSPRLKGPNHLEAHSFTHLVSDAGYRLRSLPGFQPEQLCMAFLCGLGFLTAWWLGS